jgi:hypothetical protein
MKRDSSTVLASAARSARKRGMTSEEALAIVAREFGAVFNDHGRIDGWTCHPDERAVRELPTTKPTDETPPSDGKEQP